MKIVTKDSIKSTQNISSGQSTASHSRRAQSNASKSRASIQVNGDFAVQKKQKEKRTRPADVSNKTSKKNRKAAAAMRENASNIEQTDVTRKKTNLNTTEASRVSPYDRFMSLIRFNIAFKLSLGYTMRLFILTLVIFLSVGFGFTYYLYNHAADELDIETPYVLDHIYNSKSAGSAALQTYLTQRHLTLLIYGMDETLLYSSGETAPSFSEATEASFIEMGNLPSIGKLRTLSMDTLSDGTDVYCVIQKSLDTEQALLETIIPIAMVLFFALMLSSSHSTSRMAKKHLKPITVMTDQVKNMSLSNRLNISGTKDELKDLAQTFNSMLDDIEQSYDREKQFVSDASHELRTPIAVIKGYAGMLNRWGKDDPSVLEESIQAILSETENMHSLVESLLFIARNDKGTLQMEKTTFNFSDLLLEIVKETHLIDTSHKVVDAITQDIWIYGAPDKLKQAIRVFIDNSIKYTPSDGEIQIELRHTTTEIIVKIADNGIGISEKDLPHIFDRFYRADKSRSKMKETPAGGTGLGLSIAKIIVEQHEGTIHVESDVNLGTTFTLFLPIHTT